MRTASRTGICPESRKRRTLLYDARSTSMEKVESGLSVTRRNPFSAIRPYSSVFMEPVSSASMLSGGIDFGAYVLSESVSAGATLADIFSDLLHDIAATIRKSIAESTKMIVRIDDWIGTTLRELRMIDSFRSFGCTRRAAGNRAPRFFYGFFARGRGGDAAFAVFVFGATPLGFDQPR